MNERVEAAKTEIRDNIEKMDRGVEHVGDNATRMKLAREIAELKAETAPLLGNARDLAPFAEPGESGRYRGIESANTPRDVARKTTADDQVRVVAERYGVDPEATVERYSGPAPSKGLERQFAQAEIEERDRSRAGRGEGPEDAEARQQALTRMHREIAEVYTSARGRHREQEADRAQPVQSTTTEPQTSEAARQQPAARPEREQERADAERSRRERDDSRGL